MAPRVFLTGVTGYVGGDVLAALYETHPDFEYTLLVRNKERGGPVADRYPQARLVYGTLDDADGIEKEAGAADIVIHMAESADNVPSAKAIAKGISEGHTADKPGYWIHLSGTGILQWYDETHARYGQPPVPEQCYNDVTDIDRILNMPDQALHRDVEKIVLAASEQPGVRTCIVAPPTIYGRGRGPGNRRSQQVEAMARFLLKQGYAPIIGTGKVEWDNIHVHDVSSLFVLLVEAALDPSRRGSGGADDAEVFGPRGYFYARNGTHTWGDVARWVADAAFRQGFMAEPKTETVTMEEVCRLLGSSTSSWGTNSRCVAERAAKFLGWQPREGRLEDEIPNVVKGEAEVLGIAPTGHMH